MQDGSERVISYFSRMLTRPEQQYCVTRREFLAVVESVKYFHHYLLGRHFVVRMDHGSLKWLMCFKNPECQMWRWIRVLSTYDFEIQHRPGKQHGNADGLSRRPCQECRHCEQQEFKEQSADQEGLDHGICAVTSKPIERTDRWCEPWSMEQIRAWQAEDSDIALALMWKQASRKPAWKDVKKESVVARTYWSMLERLCVLDRILYRSPDPNSKFSAPRLVPPRAIREQIFIFSHASRTGSHLRINRTASSMRRWFWWPSMKNDVIRWCWQCELCQHHNLSSGPHRSSLHQEPVGAPMECLAFDILSFPVETTEGNTCVLVICDYFTKWVEAFSLADHRAMSVANVLVTEIFLRFGMPRYLHSDQAPEFMARAYDQILWAPGGPAHSYHSVPSSVGRPGQTFQQDLNRHALKILQREIGWLGSTSALPLVCLPVFSEWEHWLYTKFVDVGSRDYIACRSDVSFNTVSEIQMS